MESYVDKSKVSLRPVNKKLAKDMIEKYHYSGVMSACRYTLGVFYKSDNHKFFDGNVDDFIGIACYGFPVGRSVVSSMFTEDVLENKNVLELKRLFIHDGYGKNIESYVISQSFKWLKEYSPDIKVLISYADPEQAHDGCIYQATNWIYQGCGSFQLMPTYSLRLNEEDDWMHSRNVYSMYGSNNLDKMKKAIGHDFWLKRETTKHRYIYFLGNKKENRNFNKILKHPSMDYPKDTEFIDEVIKVEVKDNKWKD